MPTLTKGEAEELTTKLKSKSAQLAKLITRAHDEEVWKPLGYESFTQWADKELPFTYARAFQLLNIGVLTNQLHEIMKLPEDYVLTDRHAREIITYGRKLFLEAAADFAVDDASANAAAITSFINEVNKPVQTATPTTQSAKQETGNPERTPGEQISARRSVLLLSNQARDFPNPAQLDDKTKEQGLTVLMQAQSSVQKHLDELIDLKNKNDARKGNSQ